MERNGERTEQIADWFPATTPDMDIAFPQLFERLGLVLRGGGRLSVTLAEVTPTELRGISIATGKPESIRWDEIDLIVFFDRPKQ